MGKVMRRIINLENIIWGACAVLLFWTFFSLKYGSITYLDGADAGFSLVENSDWGEFLIHGVASKDRSVSYLLPLSSVMGARLFSHGSFEDFKVWRLLILLAAVGLVFSLGRLLGPASCAALAVAFSLSFPQVQFVLWNLACSYNHFFIALLVVLAAGIMVWRARAPSLVRSLLLGLTLGATFIFRSPLAFFPPILAGFEWFCAYRAGRGYWRHFLMLCVVPYLFIIPWVRMNWMVYHRFVPFENGEAAPNIIRGALGAVLNSESDWRWFDRVGDSVDNQNLVGLLRWAAGEVFFHPLRYLEAFSLRCLYVFKLYPVLFILAAAALWLHRRREDFRQLGLLTLYYIFIHCTMSVANFYFWPLWPLLAVLSVSCAGYFINAAPVSDKSTSYRFSVIFLISLLGIVLAGCFHVFGTVNLYAHRARLRPPTSEEAWFQAETLAPKDAWLLFQRGKRKLERGDTRGAIEDFSAATSLKPGHFLWEEHLAWARSLEGDHVPLMNLKAPQYFFFAHMQPPQDIYLFKAHSRLKAGRPEEVQALLRLALKIKTPDFDGDHVLNYSSANLAQRLNECLKSRPAAERLALFHELSKLEPNSPSFWLEQAALRHETGQRDLALRLLERAAKLHLEPFERKRADELAARMRRG